MTATIKDVAEHAGLSVSTVSRFLNNHPYISEDKKARIHAAMKALDYEPSTAAQQMRGVKSHRIGILVSRITNPFFANLVDALEVTARKNGYSVLIVQNHDSVGEEANCLDLLKKKIIDGLILCSVESDKAVLEKYQQHGPILLCNTSVDGAELPVVRVDDEEATFNAIGYLLEQGYQKIAYCTGGDFLQKGHGERRNRGFQKAMTAAGKTIDNALIFRRLHTYKDGIRLAEQLAARLPSARPDVVFTGSDDVACGLVTWLTNHDIRVPQDIAVVGFDNLPVSEMVSVPITTVNQPVDKLGQFSVEYLIALIAGKPYRYNSDDLKAELVLRKSA
ncbi:LacI family DNA-binding transcriptional regulator [Cedecea sp. P7760]|jgi:DNA-binding LacI/PurR family transcriptional regulator|uniref:LacI family DNA-binding transcriptional regulator n=1 Tax=Cedecea TaxID=158483 RepID=UPI0015A473D4|nr:LacI family DNA-binding transcriptional regulator [Cedecea sp. P7760]NWC64515.1 LacI family DNA-binding transcriptional regulator [Cedecea sp. P7760]